MHKGIATVSILALGVALSSCKKHDDTPVDTTPAPAASTPAATPAAEPTPPPTAAPPSEAQAKLDYATMEDGYINDANGQWATAAKASSAFGDADKLPPESQDQNTAWQATGTVNGKEWTNNRQDIGFDWLQLDYERPVSATAVRAVLGENAAKAITKVELLDADGAAHTVWSGVSDATREERGPRTWFVRTFEATTYPVKSVKLTFANNVSPGYKEVDAVQLVGK